MLRKLVLVGLVLLGCWGCVALTPEEQAVRT